MIESRLSVKNGINWESYFIGELSNAQFISYVNLSSLVGISAGTLHNEGSGWLRFIMDGVELIVAKKTIRHSIRWDAINSANCVYGNKSITINGKLYKVRLLTGADENPTPLGNGYYLKGTHNSEFSRLFYPLVKDDTRLPSINPLAPYTQVELSMSSGNGRATWCQETSTSSASQRVIRGSTASSNFTTHTSSFSTAYYGWRACLELITK